MFKGEVGLGGKRRGGWSSMRCGLQVDEVVGGGK